MWYEFCVLFICFLFYSVIGWAVEVCWASCDKKALVLNRGFLIGPYCPLYGVGGLLMVWTLHRYQDDWIALFVLSTVVCSILEYLTGYVLEKLFHTRWWDYTHRRFNLNGRICLGNSLLFGGAGILVVAIVHPFLTGLCKKIPSLLFIIIASLCLLIFLLDIIISIYIMFQIRKSTALLEKNKDNTEEISKLVRRTLEKGTALKSRLLKAFPDAKFTFKLRIDPLKKLNEIITDIRKKKKKRKEKG